jgi:hypothetical protein
MEESFESSTLNFLPSTALFFFDGWCRQKIGANATDLEIHAETLRFWNRLCDIGCWKKIEKNSRFLISTQMNPSGSELCLSIGEPSPPIGDPLQLPPSSSFGKTEIHHPPLFETYRQLQPSLAILPVSALPPFSSARFFGEVRFHIATGETAVIIQRRQTNPALMFLACDVGFCGLSLCVSELNS